MGYPSRRLPQNAQSTDTLLAHFNQSDGSMFLVTTNSSEQDIESSIRHVDMREEAKDRVEMERALSGQ
jgi:hypothetical protein